MHAISCIIVAFFTILFSGCATTTNNLYLATGANTICSEKNSLGKIAVLPETVWRSNQKEPGLREKMALEEIINAFENIPCGNLSVPGGIKKFYNWSSRSERQLLEQFSNEGVDTIILLRIEELTPNFFFTFSLPILWGGSNEVDFRIRVLSAKNGIVLNDMRVKRSTGGPFNIRPAHWSKDELREALRTIIGNKGQ